MMTQMVRMMVIYMTMQVVLRSASSEMRVMLASLIAMMMAKVTWRIAVVVMGARGSVAMACGYYRGMAL